MLSVGQTEITWVEWSPFGIVLIVKACARRRKPGVTVRKELDWAVGSVRM